MVAVEGPSFKQETLKSELKVLLQLKWIRGIGLFDPSGVFHKSKDRDHFIAVELSPRK